MTDVAARIDTAVESEVLSSSSNEPNQAGTRRRKSLLRRHWTSLVGVVSVIVFLGAWEWAADTKAINPLFTSSPHRIVKELKFLIQTHQLWPNTWISLQEFLIGFGLAIAVAIPLGILIGWYRPVEAVFSPFITFLNSVPRVALLPLLIIWVGIGIELKVSVVFLGAVIAILINTIAGIKALDPQLLTMARSFEASDFKIFRTIALPGSVPYILSGLRVGLGHALVGVVVGELYAANSGIGHLIAVAGNTFQTDLVMAGVVIISVFGLICTWLLTKLEKHFQSWRQA